MPFTRDGQGRANREISGGSWLVGTQAWVGSLALAMFACPTGSGAEQANDTGYAAYARPQRLVEVESGRRLNLYCMGEGAPTVIFDSGLAEPTSTWFKVQPRVSKQARACSYDRAGSGFSDAGTRAGSSANIVDDLRRLLAAAAVAPPYVLVGHSYGGMNVRLHYYLHPDDVAGMVLVDPSHEDQAEGYRMLSPRGYTRAQWRALGDPAIVARRSCVAAASKGFERGTEAYHRCVFDAPSQMPPLLQRAYLAMQQRPAFHQAQLTEEESVFAASAEQLQAARRSFMDLPVIVLTHSPDTSPLRDWETAALRESRTAMWHNLHAGLADASARGVHRVVADSDHAIQLSQPDAVVAAIIEIVDMVRQTP